MEEFNKLFNACIEICSNVFNIEENDILNKSSRFSSDIRKIIIKKFYDTRNSERNNMVNFLADKFNKLHSNIIYLNNSAEQLYDFDKEFRNNYDLFELNLSENFGIK